MNNWVKASGEPFKDHPIALKFRRDFQGVIRKIVYDFDENYIVKASPGAGNWANVPWLSILDPKITKTTQDGIYPVYLFKSDGSGVYLSLNQGVTISSRELGKQRAREQAKKIKKNCLKYISGLKKWGVQEIDLKARTSLGKSYEGPNISAKYYDVNSLPDDETLKGDLEELLRIYRTIGSIDWLIGEEVEEKVFKFIETEEDILKNIESFNSKSKDHHARIGQLIYDSTYLVYDSATKRFAASKFAAFKGMDVDLYERILEGEFKSSRFDGTRTKNKIIQITGKEYEENEALFRELNEWGKNLLGDSFQIISVNKYKFCTVSSKHQEITNTHLKAALHLSKPFLLLAGISGTGKTRFVREQAKLTNPKGKLEETYCLVSVRPDWHEPSDLLGYTSRLSGKAEYIVTDVLQFIVKAWKEIIKSGIQFDGSAFKGTTEQLASIRPFWLCLDEMNLAPVEQYFADYLSILETRQWTWDGSRFSYSCDPLLKPAAFIEFFDTERFALQNNLGVHDSEELWNHFKANGISIPFNLIVAGTVNMDETTHGFSRKVIDRALSFDFGEFFPNNFDDYFKPSTQPKMLSYPLLSDAREGRAFFPNVDSQGKQSIDFLKAVNEVLSDTPFQLAYRSLNELLLSIISHEPQDDKLKLQAIWDDFLMCKVLPRIEGDLDKLAIKGEQANLLEALEKVLENQLSLIWDDEKRPDVYRETIDGKAVKIHCRSKKKIQWMLYRLEQSGFTNFWP